MADFAVINAEGAIKKANVVRVTFNERWWLQNNIYGGK